MSFWVDFEVSISREMNFNDGSEKSRVVARLRESFPNKTSESPFKNSFILPSPSTFSYTLKVSNDSLKWNNKLFRGTIFDAENI